MTEDAKANSKDVHDRRRYLHWFRSRRLGFVRLALGMAAMLFVLGCQRSCDGESGPSIGCFNIEVVVEPGTCVQIQNPCVDGGQWGGDSLNPEGFRLCPTEEQRGLLAAVWVDTRRDGGGTTRFICADANSPLFGEEDIRYLYGRGETTGIGTIGLIVAPRLTVEAVASPSAVAVGESSQLVALARGGIPPYFYFWTPTEVDRRNIAGPITTPLYHTTIYTARVEDSGGQIAEASVTVSVGLQLEVSAAPQEIVAGIGSGLSADAQGGMPPYTYSWTPTGTLDDPHIDRPVVTPPTTTTYQVTVSDSAGATISGSVTVFVVDEFLDAHATATPSTIQAGQTSQLDAGATGGIPPYRYSWAPADSLSDATISNPVASPASTQLYRVDVTDAVGETTFASIMVTVAGSPPPAASFVFTRVGSTTLDLDASASTGNIISYTWDLSWTAASPDRVVFSPTTSFTTREFDRGTITLTIRDTDGRTATATRNFP